MAEIVEFGKTGKRDKEKKLKKQKILYPPRYDKSVTIRFVGLQQKIYQQWNPATKKFKFLEENNGEPFVSARIGSFVIDRADGRVKPFVCPSTAFTQMGEYGPEHDFKIHREGHGLQTKYIVTSLGKSEVDDNIERQVGFTLQKYPLTDIFVKNLAWELLDEQPEIDIIENRFDILDL